MSQSIKEVFAQIEETITPAYKFPYFALVRIKTRKEGTMHIPAPWFEENERRGEWASNLPIAAEKRDNEYFACPLCGERSFFSGLCMECQFQYEEWDEENQQRRYIEPLWLRNRQAVKAATKLQILRKIDSGVPDLGIESAEIVLDVDENPFLRMHPEDALGALSELKRRLKIFLGEVPDPEKEAEEDAEVIPGEDSGEVRRQVNGVWQHKHYSHDYWHPMKSYKK